MERFGNVFINKVLTMIDQYEDKRMYNFFHFNMLENKDFTHEYDNVFDKNIIKNSINKKLGNENRFYISSETLVIFQRENANNDFFAFTSLISQATESDYTLITISPGSMYDIQSDIFDGHISRLSIADYIKTWKNNVISIAKETNVNDILYESIYSEITNKYPNNDTLNMTYSNDEIEQLKEELENLKIKVAKNEELNKQQLEEFYTIIDDLKNIKPLDTKKQWVSKFMTKTSKFVERHPTTSSAVLFNITNGFSSVHTLPTAYFADKALQLGLSKDDVDKAFKLNE